VRSTPQHLDRLVGKVIEENTSLLSELGIKLQRRTFDLWPLVDARIICCSVRLRTYGTQAFDRDCIRRGAAVGRDDVIFGARNVQFTMLAPHDPIVEEVS